MSENSMARIDGLPVRDDEQGLQRPGCNGAACRYQNYTGGGVSATLDASYYKGPGSRNGKEREFMAIEDNGQKRRYIVRRLTPLECCRLQGFPDWWLDGVEGSDSAKYRLWGNGVALPCVVDVLGRIADAMREEEQDKSESPADTEPKGSDRSESPTDTEPKVSDRSESPAD